jgi:hypothetical protein
VAEQRRFVDLLRPAFGLKKRRIRRSLKTRSLEEAIVRRDALFSHLQAPGEWVSDERERRPSQVICIQAA